MSSSLGDRELRWALWYTRHKAWIRDGVIIILASIIALTWGWFLLVYGDYFLFSRAREQALARALASPTVSSSPYPVADLATGPLLEFPTTSGTDLLLTVTNPNASWVATFDYHFTAGSVMSPSRRGVVLPGDTAYLVGTVRGGDGSPTYTIDHLRWRRISSQEIPDVASWRKEHMNFVIKDAGVLRQPLGNDRSVSRAQFTVTNLTPWSYWQVEFVVLLMNGPTIRGIGTITLEQFRSGDTRMAEMTVPATMGGISDIQIIPQIDILDSASYMPLPEATPQNPES